jgi:soluble lytic murein transglycosylase-like protein
MTLRRLLFVLVVLFASAQGALADEQPGSAPSAAGTQVNTESQNDAAPRIDRISDYLTKKFGLAKEKAVQISGAVRTASEKYALPPALLLAIISIESRFKEKAKGKNGATGLMQVVPSAHRPLLKNVKDLTEPDTNIEVGSAILYGYVKSAGGDLNAALKSYGGSKAYAEMVGVRVKTFASVVDTPGDAVATAPATLQMAACDRRWTTVCIGPVVAPTSASDALEGSQAMPQAVALPDVVVPLVH